MVDATSLLGGSATTAYQVIADYLGVSLTVVIILFIILSIWSLTWKGFALWNASKKNSTIWFIVLLIFNTFGILEILYIYVFSEMKLKSRKK